MNSTEMKTAAGEGSVMREPGDGSGHADQAEQDSRCAKPGAVLAIGSVESEAAEAEEEARDVADLRASSHAIEERHAQRARGRLGRSEPLKTLEKEEGTEDATEDSEGHECIPDVLEAR